MISRKGSTSWFSLNPSSVTSTINNSAKADFLIVFQGAYGGRTSTSVTVDGVSMTKIATIPSSGGSTVTCWYKEGITNTGTITIVSTLSSGGIWHIGQAWMYKGVKTSGAYDSITSGTTAGAESYTGTLTYSTPQSLGFIYAIGGNPHTAGTNSSPLYNAWSDTFDYINAPTGSNGMTATSSGATSWACVNFKGNPSIQGASPFPCNIY